MGPVISSSVVMPCGRIVSQAVSGVDRKRSEPVRTSKVANPPFCPNKMSVFSLSPTMIVLVGSKCTLTTMGVGVTVNSGHPFNNGNRAPT